MVFAVLVALFLHNAMTISLQFLQCPPQWTTMGVIIPPGRDPLPALACTKYSHGDGDKFYMLDAPHFWDHKPMDPHMYKDPVQVVVRTILARSFIMFFNTFEYIQDPLM